MINTALSSATTELENFSMVAVENMVGGIIQAVCVMIVLLFFNRKVALLSLIGLLLSSVTLKLIKIRTTKQAPRREASREIMVTKVLEYIRGISSSVVAELNAVLIIPKFCSEKKPIVARFILSPISIRFSQKTLYPFALI